MDLPRDLLLTDPVLMALRARVAAMEDELAAIDAAMVEREDWLRRERVRETFGLG